MVLTFLPFCNFDVKRKYRRWTKRRGYVHLTSGRPSSSLLSTIPTSPCMAAPAPHRRLPAHYSPFMAAIAFPPKLDYAHCQEIRAFRNMGQSNGNFTREQGREKERGRKIEGNNSGGDGGDGTRRGFECARDVLERGDVRGGANDQAQPYARTQTAVRDRRHRLKSRSRSNTGTPITTHSGLNSVRSTPTCLGRQAAAGQGHATTRLLQPRLTSMTDMPQIVTEMDTPWISGVQGRGSDCATEITRIHRR
ncbi:hypothetical protein JB92DRAFT_726629 [Gautieria morchelliformis]|nr:hypothetical protein JB92DRAFT_726629 [Gautieria morchelliformis]